MPERMRFSPGSPAIGPRCKRRLDAARAQRLAAALRKLEKRGIRPYKEGVTPLSASSRRRRPLHSRLLALWMLLGAIMGHALLPVESPMQRTSGSAFSAGTVEVVTPPSRKQRSETAADARGQDESAQHSADGAALPVDFAWTPAAAPIARVEVPWAGAAPPLPGRLRTPQQPRAPPLA